MFLLLLFLFFIVFKIPSSKNLDLLTTPYEQVDWFVICMFCFLCSRNMKQRKSVALLETEVSKQSVIKRIDDFVDAVTEMDATILVPCRLMDMKVDDSINSNKKTRDNAALRDTDLYKLYTLVNTVKNQLQWGGKESPVVTSNTSMVKSHIRRPSTASVSSAGSTYSDTDSETGNEMDSGIEGDSDQSKTSFVEGIEKDFQTHLSGLHSTLKQMTLAASYITSRYQREVGENGA